MPTSMTFASLQQDMQNYLERGTTSDTEAAAQIPRLINIAERAIAQRLKIQGFLRNVISSPPSAGLKQGVSVYVKPDRWRQTVSMNYGSGADSNTRKTLLPRSYEYCRNYWPNSNTQDTSQPPLYYADYNYSWWLIVPTPPASYPWEINYYELPALLDDTNQTNWLTDFAPNLLLYRCLYEMTVFLKDDERIPTWEKLYEEQVSTIDTQDLQKVADRDSVRNKA